MPVKARKPPPSELSVILRQAMAGTSQELIAKHFKVTRQAISLWIREPERLPAKRLEQLCKVIGINVDFTKIVKEAYADKILK